MKKLLLTAICGCMAFFALAQTPTRPVLKVTVTDSVMHQPLGFVTITLSDATTGKNEKSGLTKDNGVFEVVGLTDKAYKLSASFVGYKTKLINITPQSGKLPATADVQLTPANNNLNEVSVKAPKQLIKQEIDRLSYDVQADPESKALTAMELLRKVRLVSVDGDDNIQLQGSGDYKIFINGKPSQLLVNNPKDVLRAMPANTIQKIEVITTPPSKYDAEGLAGIINIITTKKTTDGYNGTLTSRYNNIWGGNVNASATARSGKFGVSVSGTIGHQNAASNETQNLRNTFGPLNSTLVQNGTFYFGGGNFKYISGDFSYELDTLHLLTASISYNYGNNNQDNQRISNFNDQLGHLQSYNMFNDGDIYWRGVDAGLNYQIGFKRDKNQLLTLSYQYSNYSNGRNNNVFLTQQVNYPIPNFNQLNDAGGREQTIQADYVQPAKKWNIEAGAKAILRNNYSDYDSGDYNATTATYAVDPTRSNNFTYHQNIISVYNSYQLKLTKWTFKAGVRGEHTHIDANFISNGVGLDRDYTNVIPSISILHNLEKNNTLTLGITNRLSRPGIQLLNPYIDKSNLQLQSMGNPLLQPVISNLFELSYNRVGTGTLNTRLSYLFANNNIENVTRVISDTLSQSTYENVSHNKILRLNFNGSYPFTPKFSVNFNTGVFYVWVSGFYNGQLYSNKGPRTNTYISGTYKLTKDWLFNVGYGYNRRYIDLQGSSRDYTYSSFSATRTIKAFTLTLIANNPFSRYYLFTRYNDTDQFYQSNTSNQIYRTFSFSASYKFGRLSNSIKKNKRGITNDDTTNGN
jgi:hypothetical protein